MTYQETRTLESTGQTYRKGKAPVVLFHEITSLYIYFEENWIFVPIKSCFALELNWTQKVSLQQPAILFLSNSNVVKQKSVEWSWFLET